MSVKWEDYLEMETKGRREGKKGEMRHEYSIHMYENIIIKPMKIFLKRGSGLRKSNRGGGFYQSTLYTCMETSQ
jgi:hypothetical protein